MRSGMRKELWLCANGNILGCAVNHVLSCHGFRFLLIFFRSLLGYLTDCNVAVHSVDSDIFLRSHQSICEFQVLHYNLYFLKQCQIVVCKLRGVYMIMARLSFRGEMKSCTVFT